MRYFLDPHTGDWLTRDEWEDKYDTPDIQTALKGRKVPRGVRRTAPATPYGKSGKFHEAVLHRVEFVLEGRFRGEQVNAAKYACGGSTMVLAGVAELGGERRCEKCFAEKITWHVYAYWNAAGDALYVGQTRKLRERRTSHRNGSAWYPESVWHDVLSTHDTATAALAAEREAIRRYRPLRNVHHVPKEAVA